MRLCFDDLTPARGKSKSRVGMNNNRALTVLGVGAPRWCQVRVEARSVPAACRNQGQPELPVCGLVVKY